MNTQKCIYLFVFFIVIKVTAQDQNFSPSSASEFSLNQSQDKDSETNSKAAHDITIHWFVRQATFVDYIFKQEKSYYTQIISSGLMINYQRGLIEFGAALNQRNSWAYFTAICYTIDAKNLDENWIRVFSGFGEIALIQEQQSNPDLWIYTAGLIMIVTRPFKWGTPALVLTAGGAYSRNELNLNIRAFFNLAIPIR